MRNFRLNVKIKGSFMLSKKENNKIDQIEINALSIKTTEATILNSSNSVEDNQSVKSVPGFYEADDIRILRNRLLSEKQLKLDKNRLVVYQDGKPYLKDNYKTYIASVVHGTSEIDGLKEIICRALTNQKNSVQILAPYRMNLIQHWVTWHILIKDKKIILTVHDSGQYYSDTNEIEVIKSLKNFFNYDEKTLDAFLDRSGSEITEADEKNKDKKCFF